GRKVAQPLHRQVETRKQKMEDPVIRSKLFSPIWAVNQVADARGIPINKIAPEVASTVDSQHQQDQEVHSALSEASDRGESQLEVERIDKTKAEKTFRRAKRRKRAQDCVCALVDVGTQNCHLSANL